jgi:toxin ParE1/3/4
MRVIVDPVADRDVDEHFRYIARDSLEAAVRFLHAVRVEDRKLVDMPGMGARREFETPELEGVRSWSVGGFPNHLIFYRPEANGIRVLRVLHGARDIERVLRSEP